MAKNIIYNEVSSPPVSEHFLKRPAVDTLLKNALKKPLTTVIAGAGYGKTQAVFSALNELECESAWIQLSELDNHIGRFWERISYSVEQRSRSLLGSLLSLGYPESIAVFDRLVRLLAKDLSWDKHFIFVFDDFHYITNKTILNFLDLLISARIKNLSIVLISRTKPELSLTGMLSKGLLAQITEENLRFSKSEMVEYFHKQNINFTQSMASDIYAYTDGWIIAIYLVGLAVEKGNISNQNPVLSAKINIFDLIEKEIFGAISNELQDFLIKISILDVIPSGLLKKLIDPNYSLMSEMTQTNLFIRYDSVSDSYRIHQLFKEFLLEKKERLKRDEFIHIYLAAAKWYEKSGCKSEAIEYYKRCGCYNEIFDIILSITQHVPKEVAASFIELIEQAPDDIIRARPIIRVVKTKYMFNNNRIDEAKRELIKIREEYEALPKISDNLDILGEVYIILGLISIVNQDYEFEELMKMANECLPNGSKMIDNKVTIAEGLNVCSIKDPSAGELKKHQDALFGVAPYASKVMNGCGYGIECLNAAESSLYTADLKAAEKYAYEAIYRSRQYQQYDVEYMANFVLVRIFTSKGNYEKASDILNQIKTQLDIIQNSVCTSLYDVIMGWFYMKIGYTHKVAKWIKYEEETEKILAPVHLGREYLVRSDCLLAEERYYELLAFMEQTDKMYEARGILFAVIQNKITKAIIHHYMGNHTESMEALYEAYEFSHPNNLVMQFIEYGNKMRTLVHAARLNKNCKIPMEWLDNIYTKSSTYAKQLSKVISDYNSDNEIVDTDQVNLSKRESEVLTYLSRGLTREEIAEICYLSPSSISSSIRNIYNKLGASNIADAVRIAKEKKIL